MQCGLTEPHILLCNKGMFGQNTRLVWIMLSVEGMMLVSVWPPTPFCSRFIRKSEPPGLWFRLGYLAFSLASSDLMGLLFFSWESWKHTMRAPWDDSGVKSRNCANQTREDTKRIRIRISQISVVYYIYTHYHTKYQITKLKRGRAMCKKDHRAITTHTTILNYTVKMH